MATNIKIQTTKSEPFIILPTFINGKGPFGFVVDTGAGISIITKQLGAVISIKNLTAKEAFGAGGKKISVLVGEVDSLRVGDSIVENAKIGIMEELPKCVGQGILGYDFLKNYALTIDYRNNEVTLFPQQINQSDDPLSVPYIPLRLAKPDRPIILVDVLINRTQEYQFILDTAASQTIVSPVLAKEMGIETIRQDTILGAGGNIQSTLGTVKSISVGRAYTENIRTIVSDIFTPLSRATSAEIHGILGYNFLHKFRLIIDYPNGNLNFL